MSRINPRFVEARRLRRLGSTYKAIGNTMGVSSARARQMVVGADKADQIIALTGQLSVLAFNCLTRMFNGRMPSKVEVAEISDADLLRTKGLGRKTLREIRIWQQEI